MIKLTQINEIKNLFNEVFIEAIGPNAPIIEKEIEGEKIYAYYNPNLAGFETIWEGDEIFLDLIEKKAPFFSLKLVYKNGVLLESVLN